MNDRTKHFCTIHTAGIFVSKTVFWDDTFHPLELVAPPFGVKQSTVPVILAAVLLYHADDLGLYQDGTFIPVLGTEHFELLVKYPERFAVKYFAVAGLRAEVFKELETILRNPQLKKLGKVRNVKNYNSELVQLSYDLKKKIN